MAICKCMNGTPRFGWEMGCCAIGKKERACARTAQCGRQAAGAYCCPAGLRRTSINSETGTVASLCEWNAVSPPVQHTRAHPSVWHTDLMSTAPIYLQGAGMDDSHAAEDPELTNTSLTPALPVSSNSRVLTTQAGQMGVRTCTPRLLDIGIAEEPQSVPEHGMPSAQVHLGEGPILHPMRPGQGLSCS